MAKQNIFETLDIYLSSFLTLHGIQPKLEVQNGRVIFCFIVCDDLYRLTQLYNANELVPAADFVTNLKTLRGQMLSLRGQR